MSINSLKWNQNIFKIISSVGYANIKIFIICVKIYVVEN